jgi:hypothetical protein
MTNPQSLNRYAYVMNNPASNIDPTGQACYGFMRALGACDAFMDNALGFGWNWNEFDLMSVPVYGSQTWVQGDVAWYLVGAGQVGWGSDLLSLLQSSLTTGGSVGGGLAVLPLAPPNNVTPQQAATQYCQEHGQLAFNIPFTNIPVTVSLSATALVNFSTTNDVSVTFPPSAGVSVDVTIGAPNGANIPVQVGVGKNASIGTFLTPNGPSGFSLSVPLGPVAGAPVTVSPTVGNACGARAGGG